jgi:hypothetical protein
MRRAADTVVAVFVGLVLAAWAAAPGWAQEHGRMRVQRMDGTWLEGQVEETPEGYVITVRPGISITLKKSEVKALQPAEPEEASRTEAEEEEAAGTPGLSNEEIEQLLEGLDTGFQPAGDESVSKDTHELPLDEAALKEMLFLAGTDKYLTTPHVVLVYTSSDAEARRLAARLEAIWRWRVAYMEMLGLPLQLPPSKLEVFFFGTHKEFETYSVNSGGGRTGGGVLGYYSPNHNRSCFFDMKTWPPIERLAEPLKDKKTPPATRQKLENTINRWVEFQNMAVVQHEIGHHIDFNIGIFPRDLRLEWESYDALPRWLVEGTTMMFELPPTRAGASFGTVNHARLNEFRQRFGQQKPTPAFLKTFVVNNGVFMSGGGTYYPFAWALVYYLFREHRQGLAEYARIISERDPGEEVSYSQREKEFEDCFGKIDEKWIDRWYKFMSELRLLRSMLPPDIRP